MSAGRKYELWKLTGKETLNVERLDNVTSLEEAVRVILGVSGGKGTYHLCDDQGELVKVKVARVPVAQVIPAPAPTPAGVPAPGRFRIAHN